MAGVSAKQWQAMWLEFVRESSMFVVSAEAHGPGSHAWGRLTEVGVPSVAGPAYLSEFR